MDVQEIQPKEAEALLKRTPGAKLVDVRTEEEFEIARIPGALLVDTKEKALELLAVPKDTPLLFQCHHGMRSRQAAEFFASQGFEKVYNLTGGIDAWSRDVDPSIQRY